MKCFNCGNEIDENSKFCSKCGKPVNNNDLKNPDFFSSDTNSATVDKSYFNTDVQNDSNIFMQQSSTVNGAQNDVMISGNSSDISNEMMKDSKKNNNLITIILILILFAVLVVGGFFVYKEVMGSDSNISEKDKNNEKDNDEKLDKIENKDENNKEDKNDISNDDEKDNENIENKDEESSVEDKPVYGTTKVEIGGYEFIVPDGSYYEVHDGNYFFYDDKLKPTFIVNLLICNYSIDYLKSNFEALKNIYSKEGYTFVTSESVSENGVDYFMASLIKGQNIYLDMYSELNSSACAETMITFVSTDNAGEVAANAALYVQKLISSAKKVDASL